MINLAECTFLFLANIPVAQFPSYTVNPLFTLPPPPPRGDYLFQTRLRGSLKEPGAYLGGWGLFDLAKMVLSVLHKKTRMQSG